MNCDRAREASPLFLSGELASDERKLFEAHLAVCPDCAEQMEQDLGLDARIAAAVRGQQPDPAALKQRVSSGIAQGRHRRLWLGAGAIAASLVAALGLAAGYFRQNIPTRAASDAARDHLAEVIDRQPRRWKTAPAEMAATAAQHGLSFAQAASLAPAGYSLEQAKTCGLDGTRVLHLVFSNGSRRHSVYVGADARTTSRLHLTRIGDEEVAAWANGHFALALVTAGPAEECEQLARFTASRLPSKPATLPLT